VPFWLNILHFLKKFMLLPLSLKGVKGEMKFMLLQLSLKGKMKFMLLPLSLKGKMKFMLLPLSLKGKIANSHTFNTGK